MPVYRLSSAVLAFLLATLFLHGAKAAPAMQVPAKDEELQQLVIDDQRDRTGTRGKPWPQEITDRDRVRRAQTLAILKAGRVRSGTDFSNAALIFQHGESEDDFRLAYSLAWTAYSMLEDGTPRQFAGWLSAAAWDRLMIVKGKKQWYGTQYARDAITNQLGDKLPYDQDAVSAEEKERFKMKFPQ